MEEQELSFDSIPPGEIKIEAVEGYHLGGSKFSASFQLFDEYMEFYRSYLLTVDLSNLAFEIKKQIEDSMESHVSYSENEHDLLEIGGFIHHMAGSHLQTEQLMDGVLSVLWHWDPSTLFAIGGHGGAYIRENMVWSKIETSEDWSLFGIGGNDRKNIYAAGQQGLLVKLDGYSWQKIPLDTDVNFKSIQVDKNGVVYLAGEEACFEYKNAKLNRLDCEPFQYFGVCEFKGKRYWSDANFGISVQNGNKIEKLKNIGQGFRMHSSSEFLVVTGWKEILIFDGNKWDGFSLSYDGQPRLTRMSF